MNKVNNDTATQHLLTPAETDNFKFLVNSIQNLVHEIIIKNDLKGEWLLSEDMKWLVKIGD